MISKESLFDLYNKCLVSENGPFHTMGEQLVKSTGVAAVSLWIDNPRVPEAMSRVVFHSTVEHPELAEEDHKLAVRVSKSRETMKGTAKDSGGGSLSYWATPIVSRRSRFTLAFWSTMRFTSQELDFFSEIPPYLATLVDVALSSDLFSAQRVTRELQMAQLLQKQLMPRLDSLRVGSTLAYRTLPAHELGGDYVDIIPFQKGIVGLILADAMGHGVPAAFVMLMARTIFRLVTRFTIAPSQALSDLNRHFISEVIHLDTFVTQFYAVLDPSTQRLVYGNAGHNPPLVFRKETGKVSILPGKGIALGVKPDAEYPSFTAQLNTGDIVVIYSDGLKESRDARGKQFGIDGISQILLKYKEYDADGICDGLMHNVVRYSKAQSDDISMIVIKP